MFFHFGPSNGGGVQANVERWFGQFEGSREKIGAKTEEAKIAKHKRRKRMKENRHKKRLRYKS